MSGIEFGEGAVELYKALQVILIMSPPYPPSLQWKARGEAEETSPRRERSSCGTLGDSEDPSPNGPRRQEGLVQSKVICGRAAVARGSAVNQWSRRSVLRGYLPRPH